MRTVLSARHGKDGLVTHSLEDGEVWAQFGAEQPNGIMTHDESWFPYCPLCVHAMLPSK